MKTKDILIVKHINDPVMELVYMASTQTQHLFSKKENIVNGDEKAILFVSDIGTTSLIPINKKHNFIQLDENTWELDIEPIDKDDLY